MSDQARRLSRRDFVVQGAAALGAVAASPAFASAGIPKTRVMHIIGYSHIDAAWLWPWRDGSNLALTTFRSALDRMIETPDLCYSHSSSAHYRWAQQADPQLFAEIQERVRQGRWEVVGGCPVEADCNLPATESFVRQSLYGKQYCRQALGVDVKIGLNPDSFGHAAGLPTILRRSGYGYYVFMRPQPEEESVPLPLLFWWEGPDGSHVLTLRLWKGYDRGSEGIHPASEAAFASGVDHAAFFLGVGDHGGAVTKEQIRQIVALRNDPDLPELRFSTLQSFFAAVESSPAFASLPVIKGELQHHARGCYSANGEGKILNRRAERWLTEAETVSLVANRFAGHAYPGPQYAEAWWKVCFNQFHDMMAGTSLYSDYQDVRDSLGSACETAQTHTVEALEVMARRVDMSSVPESAVFLFNPLPWRRRALVEYHLERGFSEKGDALVTHLLGHDGQKVPVQWRPSDSMTGFFPRISAWVDLPACGYRVFELAHGEAPPPEKYANFVTLSDKGFGISSLKAEDGTELLASPVGLVAIRDTSDTWAHGVSEFREEIGRPTFISSTVVENGPVTRVTRHRATWQSSEIVLDIAEFAGMDFVELRFVIDWHEHEQMLMLEIPTALQQPRIFAKVPGDVLERKTNGEEEPYQDWAAVQGAVGGSPYTVSLLNNSTYSYNCLNGLLRSVLIRSAPFARHNPWQVQPDDINVWQDQGRQERRFWLMGGRGEASRFLLDRRAEELQTPAEYVMDSVHRGTEPREKSFLEIMPGNVWVLAVKQAENGDAAILRVQERSGSATRATLKSELLGLDHSVALAPWEMKTILVNRVAGGRAEIQEVSCLEV